MDTKKKKIIFFRFWLIVDRISELFLEVTIVPHEILYLVNWSQQKTGSAQLSFEDEA